LQRAVVHPLVAAVALPLYRLAGLLPVDVASALGGRIGRLAGPRTRLHGRARRNLERAFPDKAAPEIDTILAGMWDNLGRTLFEFPHIGRFRIYEDSERFEVVGLNHFTAMARGGKGGIVFSGHLANWEIMSVAAAQAGAPPAIVYREPDNRFLRGLFARRKPHPDSELLPKGAGGAKRALAILKQGRFLGLLADQKMNDGIPVPFFGRTAMTAPALAQMALRFDCPVLPARVERLGGARFRITAYPPLDLPRSGDRQADVLALMTRVNELLEQWIRERPEQWLWIHRRWPD
jgi:KDO2-lipid IV(A) lauroyltransferase